MKKQPVISILGRPNVGKSTLFNRLTKTKKAIIDDTPGVTRDVLKQEFLLGENEISVILQDTGGLTDEGDILNPLVQKKSVEALKTSDLILFMVEAKNVLPIEEEFINMIRKSGKPAIIIMNKSDSLDKDIYIHDFHQYGLGEPLPISAAHNRNIDELLEMIEAKLQLNIEEEDEDDSNEETETSEAKEQDESLIKIAIVGKPNVGKSSLLNKITQKERSIVSNIPGTTRDIIDESITYKNHEFRFLDTAGIRKKSKVSEDIEYYSVNRSIKAINDADITLLVIDSLEDVSEQDKKITDQIVKNGKGLIVLFNKMDLYDNSEEAIKKRREILEFKFPQISYAPTLAISAVTGKGIGSLLEKILLVKGNLNRKITTSKLNAFIQDVVKRYQPSSKKGVLRISYGVQSSIAPVEFIFFLNNTSLISDNYRQYISNRLREYFHYEGVPIKIIYKEK
ncbi:MAG: ribosome biogenesis GTPase Der [Spirochaetales bacterium]|nr:ribosome biogenesis GTPase Der [Spirochaetales bacterium]